MNRSLAALSATLSASVFVAGVFLTTPLPQANAQDVAMARYTDDGEVIQPVGWRSWIYVGTPFTPNALNGGEAAFPEFHNVYVEPGAFAAYSQTGEWPEGTQIAKELVLVREGCPRRHQRVLRGSLRRRLFSG